LIDEFLAKSGSGRCTDFKETSEVIAKVRLGPKATNSRPSRQVAWNADAAAPREARWG